MPEPKLAWSRVERRLRNAENYWLCTTRADGRPHARPVWGVWHAGGVWFGTGQRSVKGRNLARDPRAVLHLESGDAVVILDGAVERVTNKAQAEPVLAALGAKYGMSADEMGLDLEAQEGSALYVFRPAVAHAWFEGLFLESDSRFELA